MLTNATLTLRKIASKRFLFLFGLVFYTSWLYQISLGYIEINSILLISKNVLLVALIGLLIAAVDWRLVKPDSFLALCVIWGALNAVFWIKFQEPADSYVRRLAQAVFAFLFVTFLRQQPNKNPCSGENIRNWFYSKTTLLFICMIIALSLTTQFSENLLNGFGNSRVNFSIWLVQIVALLLISIYNKECSGFRLLFFALVLTTPVFILQSLTGGRTGLLGSLLIILSFAYTKTRIRGAIISFAWLFLVTQLISSNYAILAPQENLDVLRNVVSSGSFFERLDAISSYRLSIITTAFSDMNFKDYVLGVGLGQFVGWAPTYPELGIVEVHNVLLKTLGEFGITGFATLTALVMLPIFRRPLQTEAYRGAILIQFVYLIMAMLHPDLMFTAINVSFVYLALYATTLKPT
ncbi:O-antigen ligase like membrane family protein [Hydrogenophaga sp. RAC07]|uniref:hypothetical protein n=1 Tax=Hydrogenophaga sp. RAC07 TaxID=1842537 RepID=UPI00085627FA|nr:hypothetical protein [Hydrogenophaga sp. RAC07]AOF84226.1 O-antigen ligase like membrane family protein [Hydrogenophaga sp. RAC07]